MAAVLDSVADHHWEFVFPVRPSRVLSLPASVDRGPAWTARCLRAADKPRKQSTC